MCWCAGAMTRRPISLQKNALTSAGCRTAARRVASGETVDDNNAACADLSSDAGEQILLFITETPAVQVVKCSQVP